MAAAITTTWVAILLLGSPAAANQVLIEPSQDAAIYSESATSANGSGSFLFAGNNSASATRRSLVRFDVSAAIPAGSTITAVQLYLNVSQANAGSMQHTVHRVNAPWGEGASDPSGAEGSGTAALAGDTTWVDRFFGASQTWATPGGDFVANASTTTSIDGVGGWFFPSTSALVADTQAMLDTPGGNFGWIVRGAEGTPSSAKRFDSRSATNALARPRLIVDFTPPCLGATIYCVAAPNSASPGGALISPSGSQSVAANNFTLSVTGLPPATTGLFFFGPNAASVPFGDGVRCIGGGLRRTAILTATPAGTAQRTLDFTVTQASDITGGTNWNFQFWYRDLAAGGAGFNVSNAVSVNFCP